MVTLIKIKKTDEYIEANYIPETEAEVGYIKIRLSDREVTEYQLTPSDGNLRWYFRYARRELERVIEENVLPEKRVCMWY